MSDLISRQAAIDALVERTHMDDWEDLKILNPMLEVIDNLPSAQPDVTDRNVVEWDMFDLITSAYYGKMMYSKQDNGIVYSRYSCKYMSVDEAIREFLALIGGDVE